MPTLFEYYNTGQDHAYAFPADPGRIAQTFTPSISHTVTLIKLQINRQIGQTGGIVYVGIRATSGGEPTGSDLCSGTFDGTTMAQGEVSWKEFTLGAGTLLTAGTQYAICVHRGNFGNSWHDDATSATYSGGQIWSTGDQITWIGAASQDYMFEDWGTALGYARSFGFIVT